MSLASAALFLSELRQLGIEVEVQGDRLACGPRSALTLALLQRLAEHKPDLLSLLSVRDPTPDPWFDRPWPSADQIVWLDSPQIPPDCPCYCCNTRKWWRLRGEPSPARPWVCGRCHPPQAPPDSIEWAEAVRE